MMAPGPARGCGRADRVLAVGLEVDATLQAAAPRLPRLGHLVLLLAAALHHHAERSGQLKSHEVAYSQAVTPRIRIACR